MYAKCLQKPSKPQEWGRKDFFFLYASVSQFTETTHDPRTGEEGVGEDVCKVFCRNRPGTEEKKNEKVAYCFAYRGHLVL
jgi:hypothetical protein